LHLGLVDYLELGCSLRGVIILLFISSVLYISFATNSIFAFNFPKSISLDFTHSMFNLAMLLCSSQTR